MTGVQTCALPILFAAGPSAVTAEEKAIFCEDESNARCRIVFACAKEIYSSGRKDVSVKNFASIADFK